MPWWGWTIVGVLLLSAEIVAVDAHFYLIFIGIGALIVGLAELIGFDLPVAMQWLTFAVLSVLSMFTIRKHLYEKLRARPIGTVESDVGREVRIGTELPPGGSCRVEYRGSSWTAVNVGREPIAPGAAARIEAVEGLTLRVSPSPELTEEA